MGKIEEVRQRASGGAGGERTKSVKKAVRKKPAKKPSLRTMNRWLTEHHEQVLEQARRNCLRLTGKETL